MSLASTIDWATPIRTLPCLVVETTMSRFPRHGGAGLTKERVRAVFRLLVGTATDRLSDGGHGVTVHRVAGDLLDGLTEDGRRC